MDLILIIISVALAMLLSNIKAARKRQQAAMKETQSDAEDMPEQQLHKRHNPWQTLLAQLTVEVNDDDDDEDDEDEDEEEFDDDAEEIFQHESHAATYMPARQPSAGRMTASSSAAVNTPNQSAIVDIAATAPTANLTTVAAADTAEEEEPALREDFDLRRAVIYSEILKPKFDNYPD